VGQQKASAAGLIGDYVDVLSSVMRSAVATDSHGKPVALDFAVEWSVGAARRVTEQGGKIIFAGNGGSAGIASHMATDYSKNGGLRAWAMNDGSMLTCLANDYGYEHVFAKQIEYHGRPGDMLVAISSSGGSANILGAVKAARKLGCTVLTLSGFKPDNPLRKMGDMNVYLDSAAYGYVEIGHLALCHAILDYSMEWAKDGRAVKSA
jgi:D-sedoheptulose 7-phosphate isomerase